MAVTVSVRFVGTGGRFGKRLVGAGDEQGAGGKQKAGGEQKEFVLYIHCNSFISNDSISISI